MLLVPNAKQQAARILLDFRAGRAEVVRQPDDISPGKPPPPPPPPWSILVRRDRCSLCVHYLGPQSLCTYCAVIDDQAQVHIRAPLTRSATRRANIGLDTLSPLGPRYPLKAALRHFSTTRAGTKHRRAPERAVFRGAEWTNPMIRFESDPANLAAAFSLRIIRTPAMGSLTAMILNQEPVCCAVHWCGERTVPHCSDGPCKYCGPENPLKIECYFGAWLMQEDRVFILSITEYAAQPILWCKRDLGDLRGRVVKCRRPTQKKNGKIEVSISAVDKLAAVAPPAPDLRSHLTYVFQINQKHLAIAERAYPAGQDVDDLQR